MSSLMFINNSGLPVNLETWQTILPGLDSLSSILVKSGEQVVLPSTTGEWFLQTYLDKEFADEWKAAGYSVGSRIGKFRNKPCMSGEYVWIDDTHFDIIYDKKKLVATFVKK